MKQPCSRWGCKKDATYDKPLCYEHWLEWQAWELEECSRCHWFYGGDESVVFDTTGYIEEYPFMCDDCLAVTLVENGRGKPWVGSKPEKRPIASHAKIERPRRYIYILKLSDATYYVGQTNDLTIRIQEHKDDQQRQTKGKDPKLVFFAVYDGMRDEVNELEKELTHLNQTGAGRRHLRQMIEEFRVHLRLIDLEV